MKGCTNLLLSVLLLKVAETFLLTESCQKRCLQPYTPSLSCQCNVDCSKHGNCCPDYHQACDGGSTTSHTTLTQATLADRLWTIDPDRFDTQDVHLNTGSRTYPGNTADTSPLPLFSSVNSNLLSRPLYKTLFALYDDYEPRLGVSDPLSVSDRVDISHFLDVVMASPVMKETHTYLEDHGLYTGDMTAFRKKIFSLWFDPYPRSKGKPNDSSAFEHVFVGEYKGTKTEGLHNWVRFYYEEKAGHINYLGYSKQHGQQLLKFPFTWNGHYKDTNSFIIGSSPVFDMALGTVCFLTKPNSECAFSLHGYQFRIKQYDASNAAGPQLATAYVVF
ncbi:uridylate-specific endoribonuclease-like isoform X2 [Haliotis rubra]|uniref:uridylate-specific endoribonuclease-like isoform X2 n=1 Tax=Haliotis rubra TaxID=36100 RepID=UPI001EE5DC12|nr:uridylate-specific endoribonuclease-like isoform X2 [Haliotis rubra]